MRRVTYSALRAFTNKRRYSGKNTKVVIQNDEAYMYLFGNLIAKTERGDILINHCGWITATTQDRLNAFNVTLRREKGQFIVNEKFIWKCGWLNINDLH